MDAGIATLRHLWSSSKMFVVSCRIPGNYRTVLLWCTSKFKCIGMSFVDPNNYRKYLGIIIEIGGASMWRL